MMINSRCPVCEAALDEQGLCGQCEPIDPTLLSGEHQLVIDSSTADASPAVGSLEVEADLMEGPSADPDADEVDKTLNNLEELQDPESSTEREWTTPQPGETSDDNLGENNESEFPNTDSDPAPDAHKPGTEVHHTKFNIKNSTSGPIFNVQGVGAGNPLEAMQYISTLLQAKEINQRDEEEKTLLEFTTVLPPKQPVLPKSVADQVPAYFARLNRERVLLISCPDDELAFSAAVAIIDEFKLQSAGQKRLLTFNKNSNESPSPSVYHLGRDQEAETKIVILVDAVTDKAQSFMEPILYANSISITTLHDDLERNDLYLLCLVDAAYLAHSTTYGDKQRQSPDLKLTSWQIPFLQHLLQVNLPEQSGELERRILEQRACGWWSLNESEFYYELKSYIGIGPKELLDAVNSRDASKEPPPVVALFKGDDSLNDTVLYVAAFFENLTPYEFSRIVPLLLGERRWTMPHQPGKQTHNETRKLDDGERDKLLLRTWKETPDKILKECSLVVPPAKDSTKRVTFSNHKLKENLKKYLENDYSLYLESKFQILQDLGLLFSPFSNIAKGTLKLVVSMMSAYPEYYGGTWLAETLAGFEQSLRPDNEALRAESPVWRLLGDMNLATARKHAYQCIVSVVLELKGPRLKDLVDEFFQQLILAKNYSTVLELVKRLRLAPEFDQFKWLRQLLDRGDAETRQQTSIYLYDFLKKVGTRVYQVLRNLEAWLPEENRPVSSYSFSTRFALQCLPFYCLNVAPRFDEKRFRNSNRQYPLLTFRDEESATTDLRLLVKWMFHPKVASAFRGWHTIEETRDLINILITGWFFFLREQGAKTETPGEPQTANSNSLVDVLSVSTILLEQIAENAASDLQKELLIHWETENRKMLRELSAKPHASIARVELTWKRNLMIELISKLKQLQSSNINLPQKMKA